MGGFISRILQLFYNEKVKVLILGLDDAGKTTILYRLLYKEVMSTTPTIGSNVGELTWNNFNLLFWDIGGQKSLRPSWNTYYPGTHYIVFVVDSTDKNEQRIETLKDAFHEIINHEELKDCKILIYANKQDVPNCMKAADVSKHLNLTAIKNHSWKIQPCCALTNDGLIEGINWLLAKKP
ncbi:hypothetical protein Ciccas_010250 [Cichlidogyrus casuarinus]|uniref:ADP-ribosylation factor n=1 Tax=Cichlidogyrus casuarinus TaxID=1844966 RepID=A0ABD2PWL1_9PLAT